MEEEKPVVKKKEEGEEKPETAIVGESEPTKKEEEAVEKMEVEVSKPPGSPLKEEPMDVAEDGKENEKPATFANIQFSRDARNRVKLYMLCDRKMWEDKGTGHAVCLPTPGTDILCIVVRFEATDDIILESAIQQDTIYQKQQDTLIVWSESDKCDLALSFQQKEGCDDVWAIICQVQGRSPEQQFEDDDEDARSDETVVAPLKPAPREDQLPPAELGRLEEIEVALSNHLVNSQLRDIMANMILVERYIPQLCELFQMCEDIECTESMHFFYKIAKHLFMLNKKYIIEILVSEDYFKEIIGMLEHEPNLAEPRPHRQFLYENATFKEVLPMENEELRAKIHQVFRAQYVQNVCLPTPSFFEENLLAALGSYVNGLRTEVVTMVQDDAKLMGELFEQLKDPETTVERRKELACFLKEFCSFSKTQHANPLCKGRFYQTLMSNDVLGSLEPCIRSTDPVTRTTIVDMLALLVEFSPQHVREYLFEQATDKSDDEMLLNLLIRHMFNDEDVELSSAQQVAHVLKIILDPENMQLSMQKTEKSEYLAFFYTRAIGTLCKPILDNVASGSRPEDDSYKTANEEALVLRLLSFYIEHHSFHMRQYCIAKNLLSRALVLLSSRHHFLKLAALKMLRCSVQLKDDFYNRYIVREKILDKVVECFVENGPKYNLLNSALLEFFEYIQKESIKVLIKYTVENHMSAFENVDYVKTFVNLKEKYEKLKEMEEEEKKLAGRAATPEPPDLFEKERSVELEEDWFFGDDEDEEDGKSTPPIPPLSEHSPIRKQTLAEDDGDGVFTTALKLYEKNQKKEKSPPIVIRVDDAPLSPSLTPSLSQLAVSSSPGSPSPELRNEEVTSTEKTPDNSKAATSPPKAIVRKKSLVDYDDSSSSSDEDEVDVTSSTPKWLPVPSASSPKPTGEADVTSTGNEIYLPGRAPFKLKRSKGFRSIPNYYQSTVKLPSGPSPVKRARDEDDEAKKASLEKKERIAAS